MTKRKIAWGKSFKRAYKKYIKRNPGIEKKLIDTLKLMEQDLFSPLLETHKLSGKLSGLYASSCGYDCRIVFSIEKNVVYEEEIILLINIGSHHDVY